MNSAPARRPPPPTPSPLRPRHHLQASKAVAAKIKDSLLDPKFIPRVLRPAAGFVVELVLPVSTICAIPEHIEKVKLGCFAATPPAQLFSPRRVQNLAVNICIAQLQEQDASLLGMEAVLHAFILAAGPPPHSYSLLLFHGVIFARLPDVCRNELLTPPLQHRKR
jgi:hypothetical protein